MTELQLQSYGLDRPESGDDVVVPFTLENLDCRGRFVRLGEALDSILTRHHYPEPVARLLGEAVVLAALIGSSLKFEGRFILQTQTDGPVNLIVVDLDAPDGLRGYARFDGEAVDRAVFEGRAQPGQLLGKGHLAMTVDQAAYAMEPIHQGIVSRSKATVSKRSHIATSSSPSRFRLPSGWRWPKSRACKGDVCFPIGAPVACWCSTCRPAAWPQDHGRPAGRDGDFANAEARRTLSLSRSDKWTRVRSRCSRRRLGRRCRTCRLPTSPPLSALLFRLYPRDRRPRLRARSQLEGGAAPARPSVSRRCCRTALPPRSDKTWRWTARSKWYASSALPPITSTRMNSTKPGTDRSWPESGSF